MLQVTYMDTKKIYYPGFDVVKIVLAVFIVAGHTNLFCEANPIFSDWFNRLRDFAIPSFFAISAFLFYGKIEKEGILKHTVSRLMIIFVVWYVIFFPMTWIRFISIANWKEIIAAILFGCTFSGYWFFKALIINTIILYFCRGKRYMPIALIIFLVINIFCGLNYIHHFVELPISPYYCFFYHTAEFFVGAYLCKYKDRLLNWNITTRGICVIILLVATISMNENIAVFGKEIIPIFIIALSFRFRNISKDTCVKCRKFSTLFYVMQFFFIWVYDLACNTYLNNEGATFAVLQYSVTRFSIIMIVLFLSSELIVWGQRKYPILNYLT